MRNTELKKKNILFVGSAGGHLTEILELKDLRERYNYLIVTEDVVPTRPLAGKYNLQFLKPDANRSSIIFWLNFFRNFFKSLKILISFNPHVIITTGSHTAVPMCLLGKLFRKKIIWILCYARVNTKAKSADIIYPITDLFIVQWESAKRLYPKAKYFGGIY